MAPTVYVHRNAFETMIAASVETFKRECFGVVFGRAPTKSRQYFIITNVSPMQCSKRFNTRIEGHARSERRLNKFYERMPPSSRPLGNFHSHTEWGDTRYKAAMSAADLLSMMRAEAKIEFIIAISSRKKGKDEWRANDDGSVAGSFGSGHYNYNFSMHAYVIEEQKDESVSVRIKIIAPEAIRALNRAMGY
jgi:proteasome lid subunit RPN8/RPN11